MLLYGGNSVSGDSKGMKFVLSEDIEGMIRTAAAGYNDRTVKIFVDSKRKAIESFQMLSGISTRDSEDDVGKKLHSDTRAMIELIGQPFIAIVENNFPLEIFRSHCVADRALVDEKLSELECFPDPGSMEPSHKISELRVTVKQREFVKNQDVEIEIQIAEFDAAGVNEGDKSQLKKDRDALIKALRVKSAEERSLNEVLLQEAAEEQFLIDYDSFKKLSKQIPNIAT